MNFSFRRFNQEMSSTKVEVAVAAEKFTSVWRKTRLHRVAQLSCARQIKFALPPYWRYWLQDPASVLGHRTFVCAGGSGVSFRDLRQEPCKNASDDALFVKAFEFSPGKKTTSRRRPRHVAVGNFVVFRNLGAQPSDGVVIGLSECSEDFIRHAHLCQLIPQRHFMLCAGFFVLNTTTGRLACFPRSGSWKVLKDATLTYRSLSDLYDVLDDVNVMISERIMQRELGCQPVRGVRRVLQ